MRPLVFSWPYALAFWAIYIWAFVPEMMLISRAERNVATNETEAKDAGSLRVILLGMWVALFVSFPLAFVQSLQVARVAHLSMFIAGSGLLIAGSLLRRHCWRTLGEHFTGDVQARVDQPVITCGAYRWVRHPSYTGGIVMFAGIGIALANWASLAILVLTSIFVYAYRIKVEEAALVQTLGEPYVAYMKTHKRFLPFIV
jgi:protein-S-isoprenylcysteine O-methyltransferase Ste14